MMHPFNHSPHGERFHDTAILITKSICSERQYSFLDPRGLKDWNIFPGVPDVYVRVPNHRVFVNYIIEIETNPSKASITKKTAQFSGDGVHELILIDMRILCKKKDWKNIKLGELVAFLEERIP